MPPLKFDASTGETPEAIRFRVAVNETWRNSVLFSDEFLRGSGPGQTSAPLSRALPFPQKAPATAKPMRLLPGGSRQLSGATILRARTQGSQAALRRDSSQSRRPGHDLFAAFSCGGFSPLDSGRMESPAAGATGFAVSVALRDLRVRI